MGSALSLYAAALMLLKNFRRPILLVGRPRAQALLCLPELGDWCAPLFSLAVRPAPCAQAGSTFLAKLPSRQAFLSV